MLMITKERFVTDLLLAKQVATHPQSTLIEERAKEYMKFTNYEEALIAALCDYEVDFNDYLSDLDYMIDNRVFRDIEVNATKEEV